jgi:hypothetical protein
MTRLAFQHLAAPALADELAVAHLNLAADRND